MDVREAILQAGSALLKDHGFAALKQQNVARLAGVKQSHLTYYFPKRSDLLLGIAVHTIDSVMSELATRLETASPQSAFDKTVVAAMVSGVPPKIVIGLIVAAEEEPALRHPLRKLVRDARTRIHAMLEKADVPNHGNAALLLHATVVGLAILHQAQLTTTSAKDVRGGITSILGLLCAGTLSPNKGNLR